MAAREVTQELIINLVEILNEIIITQIMMVVVLITLTAYYYKKKYAVFNLSYIITLQYIFELLFIPIICTYYLAKYSSYLISTVFCMLVLYRLLERIKKGLVKAGLIEWLVIHLQVFLVLCFFVRFVDRQYLQNYEMSLVFNTVVGWAYQLIIISLLLPEILKLVAKLNISYKKFRQHKHIRKIKYV